MEVKIIPAVQVATVEDLKKRLSEVEGLVERVQIDIVGKEFANNEGIKVEDLIEVGVGVALDVQLMVKEPIKYLNRCDVVGVERVYGHIEQMSDMQEFVSQTTDMGMEVGLALDIHTPVKAIKEVLLYLDGVLLMSVEAGFSGQGFMAEVLDKIEEVRGWEFKGDICVDGGLDKKGVHK